MKVSTIAIAAGFAAVACAAPMRIVIVTHTGVKFPVAELSDPQVQAMGAIRFGHAAGASSSLPPPFPMPLPIQASDPMHHKQHHGCGKHLKAKYVEMSNRLRKVLGMPALITPLAPPPPHHHHHLHHEEENEALMHILPFPHPHPHFQQQDSNKPFIHRLHHAVNQLGPWEGRAVAFVLGCGLGVLLRMFFVMTVLIVRRLRGTPNRAIQLSVEEPETAYVIVPAPPSYMYPVEVVEADEKTTLAFSIHEPAPEYVEKTEESS